MDTEKYSLNYFLKKYEDLYAQKEQKIKSSLKRCTDALHCKKVDRVPIWQVTQTSFYPRHELYQLRYKNLITALAKCVLSLNHCTDYVPFLDPFEGVTIVAEAFGCKVLCLKNNDPAIKSPIVFKPEDVYGLKKPKLYNKVYKRVFETLKYWEEKTGSLIPLGNTDPQSPLNVATLIWKTDDFLVSCYTNKKEVHYLLNLITESFIEFYSKQHELIKNDAYPVHAFPLVNSNDGIAVSDDSVVLMTPELFREFGIPYLEKISEAFGGIYYHSCGDWGAFINDILSIKGLRAINGHMSPKELKPEYIKKITSRGIGLFLGISNHEIGWENPDWQQEDRIKLYEKYYIPAAIRNSGGKGVVLVGHGGYMGYFNTTNDITIVTDNRGGTATDNLINLSDDEKNRNFKNIQHLIKNELQNLKAGKEFEYDKDYLNFSKA